MDTTDTGAQQAGTEPQQTDAGQGGDQASTDTATIEAALMTPTTVEGSTGDAETPAQQELGAELLPPVADASLYGGTPGSAPGDVRVIDEADHHETVEDQIAEDVQLEPAPRLRNIESPADTLAAVGAMVNIAEAITEALVSQTRDAVIEPEVGAMLQHIAVFVGDFRNNAARLEASMSLRMRDAIEAIVRRGH